MGLEKIAIIRKEKNMTLEEISSNSGVPMSTLKKISAGITTNPSFDTVLAIAQALGCSLEDFMDEPVSKNISTSEQELIQKYRRLDAHGKEMVDTVLSKEIERIRAEATKLMQQTAKQRSKVSYYDVSVSAGTGQPLDYSTLSTITVDGDVPDKAAYVVKVAGDSMTPAFDDGDYVYVANKLDPKQGDICIVWHDGNAYIKKLGKEGLVSLNPDYPVIKANKDTYILGVVIGKVTGEIEF